MLTAWCLALGFFVPWVVGVPIWWLGRSRRVLRPSDWLWVPFVGMAAIICPLQTLVVFADLPLRRIVPFFWVSLAVAWLILCASRTGRASLRTIPIRGVLLSLGVYLSQGAGVIAQGVEGYRGTLQSDQYSYVVLAQFLMDEPFSTEWETMGERPWLVMPVALKGDRIGQSILHGFLAITAGRDAVDCFFPTILLGPGLMIPAVFLLGPQCGLPRRWTTWAALAAGFAPGVLYLVSACFLSHALCLSALIAFLAAVIRLGRGGVRTLPCAVVTFVLGFVVYTEFALLFVGCAGAAIALGLARGYLPWSRSVVIFSVLALSLGLNPAALTSAFTVWQRSLQVGPAMTSECPLSVWVAADWLHFPKAFHPGKHLDLVAFGYVAVMLGATGVGAFILVRRGLCSTRRLLPSLACLALFGPPLLLYVLKPESDYVISKLILTLTPVLIVCLACGFHFLRRFQTLQGRPISLVASLVLGVFVVQSGLEQRGRAQWGPEIAPTHVWNDPDLQVICAALRSSDSRALVIDISTDGGGRYPSTATAALCYYGRQHRIRLVSPQRVWVWSLNTLPTPQLTQTPDLEPGTLIVSRSHTKIQLPESSEIVVNTGTYRLVRLSESRAGRTELVAASRPRVP